MWTWRQRQDDASRSQGIPKSASKPPEGSGRARSSCSSQPGRDSPAHPLPWTSGLETVRQQILLFKPQAWYFAGTALGMNRSHDGHASAHPQKRGILQSPLALWHSSWHIVPNPCCICVSPPEVPLRLWKGHLGTPSEPTPLQVLYPVCSTLGPSFLICELDSGGKWFLKFFIFWNPMADSWQSYEQELAALRPVLPLAVL